VWEAKISQKHSRSEKHENCEFHGIFASPETVPPPLSNASVGSFLGQLITETVTSSLNGCMEQGSQDQPSPPRWLPVVEVNAEGAPKGLQKTVMLSVRFCAFGGPESNRTPQKVAITILQP
jgi:hypothetical protein